MIQKVFTALYFVASFFAHHAGQWLTGKEEPQLPEQNMQFRVRLGIPGHDDFTAVGREEMDVYYLDAAELLKNRAGC